MPKRLCWSKVLVAEHPRVCFMVKAQGGKQGFEDVTHRVAKLVIEDLEDGSGGCRLLRLDGQDQLVWATRHPSADETRWHVEFEYGISENGWMPCDEKK